MENVNLTGQFLVAMPAMTDPYFTKSVTFICEHNADGAMGIVINRPIDMKLDALFKQVDLQLNGNPIATEPVYFGGPVQIDRGFVLHQPEGDWNSTISINGHTALTTSKDILEAIANGNGPSKVLITLGYAGWSAGQLEEEIAQNVWLTIEADVAARDHLIFDLPHTDKIQGAMSLLGLDFARFAEEAGHA
ncbi:YqgE/AlgH family protein [Methylobacillus gramineus]|uniref:YqgE/AlgH family protein n=1 Tax=Methylobacillus gramineus TaxID=755169 RepID=UPI001CFFD263|nr:YqgE/AlgH family protein [Methylobacillus gramineus]MCB5186371.1 YqgE/AlgH family protein [Methylobacillus gramineus]